jgi:DeoR/GlpR family transcriptional regulator of sugar metabolism
VNSILPNTSKPKVPDTNGGLGKKDSVKTRRETIRNRVEEHGFCSIAELSKVTGVSEMTIRRDVQVLAEKEVLKSFHGGVSAFPSNDFQGSDYTKREIASGGLKQALARRAVTLVANDDSISLDTGTTVTALAHEINNLDRLSIVTASIPAINALNKEKDFAITVLGGIYNSSSQSISGTTAIDAIANVHVDFFFLSASMVNEKGVYCGNDFDAVTKRALIEVANLVVLICDSSKFKESAVAKICGWDSIDIFIVDEGIPKYMLDLLPNFGTEVISVGTHSA